MWEWMVVCNSLRLTVKQVFLPCRFQNLHNPDLESGISTSIALHWTVLLYFHCWSSFFLCVFLFKALIWLHSRSRWKWPQSDFLTKFSLNLFCKPFIFCLCCGHISLWSYSAIRKAARLWRKPFILIIVTKTSHKRLCGLITCCPHFHFLLYVK